MWLVPYWFLSNNTAWLSTFFYRETKSHLQAEQGEVLIQGPRAALVCTQPLLLHWRKRSRPASNFKRTRIRPMFVPDSDLSAST